MYTKKFDDVINVLRMIKAGCGLPPYSHSDYEQLEKYEKNMNIRKLLKCRKNKFPSQLTVPPMPCPNPNPNYRPPMGKSSPNNTDYITIKRKKKSWLLIIKEKELTTSLELPDGGYDGGNV